jgi:hypothetical protein
MAALAFCHVICNARERTPAMQMKYLMVQNPFA